MFTNRLINVALAAATMLGAEAAAKISQSDLRDYP